LANDFKNLIMRMIIVVFIVLVTLNAFGQTKPTGQTKTTGKTKTVEQPKPVPVDTIVRLGNRKIPAFVKQVGIVNVVYTLPSKPDSMIRLELKELEKIIYRNGRVDIFNKAVVEDVSDKQWQAILLTRKEKDVAGLYKRASVAGKSKPNARSKKDAQQSANIKIQKQAAAIGATIVLITKEEYYGGFGDPQGYYVEGVAYGSEPLEKGTNVVEDHKNKQPKK
jgi:hypothetical protein